MSEDTKLKNCPFCNYPAFCKKAYCYSSEIEYHQVYCMKCFCRTERCETKKEAVNQWNTRTKWSTYD